MGRVRVEVAVFASSWSITPRLVLTRVSRTVSVGVSVSRSTAIQRSPASAPRRRARQMQEHLPPSGVDVFSVGGVRAEQPRDLGLLKRFLN